MVDYSRLRAAEGPPSGPPPFLLEKIKLRAGPGEPGGGPGRPPRTPQDPQKPQKSLKTICFSGPCLGPKSPIGPYWRLSAPFKARTGCRGHFSNSFQIFNCGSGPENGHETVLELVSLANFGCVLHHFSSPTRLKGSRG